MELVEEIEVPLKSATGAAPDATTPPPSPSNPLAQDETEAPLEGAPEPTADTPATDSDAVRRRRRGRRGGRNRRRNDGGGPPASAG
jgi:hypothetical protein